MLSLQIMPGEIIRQWVETILMQTWDEKRPVRANFPSRLPYRHPKFCNNASAMLVLSLTVIVLKHIKDNWKSPDLNKILFHVCMVV